MTYLVSTQHADSDVSHGRSREEFIVPLVVNAATPADAAAKRFALLGDRSRCTALLVRCGDSAWVFTVTPPTAAAVGDTPVSFNHAQEG